MDPIPNLDEVQHNAAYYELEYDWAEYLRLLIRADLEQAHGRLRLVHRTQKAAACHVGSELPGGYGWGGHEVIIAARSCDDACPRWRQRTSMPS